VPPLLPTGWQTVGPFFHGGLAWPGGEEIAASGTPGQHILLDGRILDGGGAPIGDALVEIWQADAEGRYRHPEDRRNLPAATGFKGFGRVATRPDGSFRFATIKPGPVPGPDGRLQAPHLLLGLMMRGLLRGLVTRIYFADEPRNAADPILALVAPDRRQTLMAERVGQEALYSWTARMQGAGETVFFDL
jgi:protocatechuate 3,4-dioxygenase, alpha subunit